MYGISDFKGMYAEAGLLAKSTSGEITMQAQEFDEY
jgi:hypothetical protein